MKHQLSDRQKQILARIFKDRDAEKWIASIETEKLSHGELDEACNLLSTEFHMHGIDERFEATNYGIEVEEILDIVNRPRLS